MARACCPGQNGAGAFRAGVPAKHPSVAEGGRVVGDDNPADRAGRWNAATSIGAVACAERRYGVDKSACTIEAPCALAAALGAVQGGMSLCPRVYPRSLA